MNNAVDLTTVDAQVKELAEMLGDNLTTAREEYYPSVIGAKASNGDVTVLVPQALKKVWETHADSVRQEVATHRNSDGSPGVVTVEYI